MNVKSYVYFDNNATIPMFEDVKRTVWAVEECGNTSGSNPVAVFWQEKVNEFEEVLRTEIAAPSATYEIIWNSGSTESNNSVIQIFAMGHRDSVIITTKIEHKCLIAAADQAARVLGCEVFYVSPRLDGSIHVDDIIAAIRHVGPSRRILVAVMHANNETGTINDVNGIARAVKAISPNAFVYVDCAQTFCKVPITLSRFGEGVNDVTGVVTKVGTTPIKDTSDLVDYMGSTDSLRVVNAVGVARNVPVLVNIDGICASAHKTGGPFGIGFLVLSRRFLDDAQFVPIAGSQNYGLRGGTYNMPGIIGFRESIIQMIVNHVRTEKSAMSGKGHILRSIRAAGIPIFKFTEYMNIASRPDKCFVYFESANTLPGTLLCSVVYNSCLMSVCNIKLKNVMESAGIIVSVGSACNASGEGMSHVLKAMNCPREVGVGVIRISSYDNSFEDYDKISRVLVGVFRSLRDICVIKK